MGRVSEGERGLTFDIPEELHKKLHFLAVQHDTTITKYVQTLLEEHVEFPKNEKNKKQKRALSLQGKHPMSKEKVYW